MKSHEIVIGREYWLVYHQSPKKHKKVTVTNMDRMGDCTVKFKNNRTDLYHCCWLKEIENG